MFGYNPDFYSKMMKEMAAIPEYKQDSGFPVLSQICSELPYFLA
jgi:hypothetical protein